MQIDAWNESNLCMFLPTAKEVWEAIRETNFRVKDAAKIYDLMVKTWSTRQGNRLVTEYSNLLKNWWQKLDQHCCLTIDCSKDSARLKQLIKDDRAHQFLIGLNLKFNQVGVHILGKEDLPSLNDSIL